MKNLIDIFAPILALSIFITSCAAKNNNKMNLDLGKNKKLEQSINYLIEMNPSELPEDLNSLPSFFYVHYLLGKYYMLGKFNLEEVQPKIFGAYDTFVKENLISLKNKYHVDRETLLLKMLDFLKAKN